MNGRKRAYYEVHLTPTVWWTVTELNKGTVGNRKTLSTFFMIFGEFKSMILCRGNSLLALACPVGFQLFDEFSDYSRN